MASITASFAAEARVKFADGEFKNSSKRIQSSVPLASNKAGWKIKVSQSILVPRASASNDSAVENAASAAGDSVVAEVASLPEEGETAGVASKKASVLAKGGSLSGPEKEGKSPSNAALGIKSWYFTAEGGFADPRWKDGTWDLSQFTTDGKVDWDAVIDAEVIRRKWLEERPESSTNDAPVLFDTSIVPWWAWVKRFHLPEAEKLNGRAAMIGYALGYLVDAGTGVGLVDQQGSFLGKLLILVSVLGVLFIRQTKDIDNLKNLAEEWTFYDKQWQATWKEGPPRGGSESSE